MESIEKTMRDANPFNFRSFEHDANYYYEARSLVRLLQTVPMTKDNALDMCMEAFQIYYDNNPLWDALATKLLHVVTLSC